MVVPLSPKPHDADALPTRDELLQIVAAEARAGHAWAVRLAFELLDAEPASPIPARYLELLR